MTQTMFDLVFFVGTDAELIKVLPIMLEAKKRDLPYAIIASGQNDLNDSYMLNTILNDHIDVELSKEESIVKSARGLLTWFIKTSMGAKGTIKRQLAYSEKAVLVVHGDTVSTVMGSQVARRLGMRVAHVEAGLRSFNWLNPFPEEIDRHLVSRNTDIHFAPGDEAANNLHKAKVRGAIINTGANTLFDSLQYARTVPCKDAGLEDFCSTKHCVMVLHRQENLQNRALVEAFVDVACADNGINKALIMHEPTRIAFENMGLLGRLEEALFVHMFPRIEYCDFMKLLSSSEYVLTDGGSNQEELSYMGTPSLILRTHTERSEGLGVNARLFDGTKEDMLEFCSSYGQYRAEPAEQLVSPSKIIVDVLEQLIGK